MLTRLLERLGLKATAPAPLTPTEFMILTDPYKAMAANLYAQRELAPQLALALGYGTPTAPRILPPLSERERHYLSIHIHNTSTSRSALK